MTFDTRQRLRPKIYIDCFHARTGSFPIFILSTVYSQSSGPVVSLHSFAKVLVGEKKEAVSAKLKKKII